MSKQHVSRRQFLESTALGAAAAAIRLPVEGPRGTTPHSPPPPFELDEATISGLQDAMRTGKYSAQRLTQLYLARIQAMDKTGPNLHAVIETNPDALAIAAQLDAERKAGKLRGPLHGIPVLIKDNIATGDKMLTTAGSLALAGAPAPRDAFVAKKLRDAGAVILGKTNLSEWANFRSSHSVSGWSGRGGQCRNPYATDRNPCGSSSGTGAAISANFATIGIGTETDGSIVCPSGANSLVGLKPTLGLVSRNGIIPIAHSQDTAGPMTRTVRDAAILLAAIAGPDSRDPATADAARAPKDYLSSLDENGLRGARIGVARKYFGFHAGVDKVMEAALSEMKKRGAELIDPADIPHTGEYDETELAVLLYELKADLNAYLASLGPKAPVRTLADVIAFNEAHAKDEMPYFGQDLFMKAQEKGPLTDLAYVEALARNKRLAALEGIDAVMAQHKLDAIAAPTGGPAWMTDLVDGDHFGGGLSTPPAVAGYPHVTVPAGYVFGLPVGISFVGRAWSEPMLIKLAYAFEQATHARRAPRLLPSADLAMN